MAQTTFTVRASYAGPTDTLGTRVTVRTAGHQLTAARNYAVNYDRQARDLATDLARKAHGDAVTLAGETSSHNGDRYVFTFEVTA